MNVVFTEQAEREIDEARAWYEARSSGLGGRLTDEIAVARDRISDMPHAWQPLEHGFRRFLLRRFPYGLVYMATDEEIVVVGFGHLRRGPRCWRSVIARR